MTGIEPHISDVGNDRYTTLTTTNAQLPTLYNQTITQ